MIALKLDNRMSKDKILEGYLNTSWFGRGTYGIQRASQAYYGKDVSKLTPSEAAMLASLLKGAGLYDPTLSAANHRRAVERWSWILDRMVKIGKLSPAERAKYTEFPEPLKTLQIYDTGKQSDYLVELRGPVRQEGRPSVGQGVRPRRLPDLHDLRPQAGERADRRGHQGPRGSAEEGPQGARPPHYGAASVATDGRILAVYGGPDHRNQGFNESNATTVPAGSAFTPFVYAAGLQHGVHTTREGPATPVTPETVYDGDDEVPVTTPEGPYWDRSGRRSPRTTTASAPTGRSACARRSPARSTRRSCSSAWTPAWRGCSPPRRRPGCSPPASARRRPRCRSAPPRPARSAWPAATPPSPRTAGTPSRTRCAASPATAPVSRWTPPTGAGRSARRSPVRSARRSGRTSAPPTPPRPTATAAGKDGTTEKDTAAWYTATLESVSTAIVVYRIDLGKSLEPLPLDGLAGTRENSVPYGIWSRAVGVG